MSEGNVDLVKALLAASARDLDVAATLVDAEMEIRPAVAGGPEGIVYRGFDGLRQFSSQAADRHF